jgi:hypothetical protein
MLRGLLRGKYISSCGPERVALADHYMYLDQYVNKECCFATKATISAYAFNLCPPPLVSCELYLPPSLSPSACVVTHNVTT